MQVHPLLRGAVDLPLLVLDPEDMEAEVLAGFESSSERGGAFVSVSGQEG